MFTGIARLQSRVAHAGTTDNEIKAREEQQRAQHAKLAKEKYDRYLAAANAASTSTGTVTTPLTAANNPGGNNVL
jgi:hypothetical protein